MWCKKAEYIWKDSEIKNSLTRKIILLALARSIKGLLKINQNQNILLGIKKLR